MTKHQTILKYFKRSENKILHFYLLIPDYALVVEEDDIVAKRKKWVKILVDEIWTNCVPISDAIGIM